MNFKRAILYFLSFPVFWVVFFLVFRVTFLLYHHQIFGEFSLSDCLLSVWHGLYMDLSMASYISVFPFLWFLAHDFIPVKTWIKVLSRYQLLLTFIFGFLLTADLGIFFNWGHRIDAAIVPYLQYPAEAFASSFSSPLRILFTIFGLSFVVSGMCWAAFHLPLLRGIQPNTGPIRWIAIVLAACLIIPIRGGFQLAPMSQSSVHFSNQHPQLNHAAENGIWVLMQSLLEYGDSDKLDAEYNRFPKEEVSSFQQQLYKEPSGKTDIVLTQSRPNVVLIIWESLTARVVGCLNGTVPSTPNLDQIAKNGILFSGIYANGDRSDKGLASILSAIPALGKLSVMKRPTVVSKLPFLSKELKNNGYQTAFLYGGELEFANMKSYMLEAGFNQMVSKEDFPSQSYNSKWGAHDEVVFAKQIEMAKAAKEPFFHTLFTLSSHEPFEVPGQKINENDPVDSLFCRAHRYTDRCLGEWFSNAKQQPWWKNTVVIIVADHGHTQPGGVADDDPEKFRIPMVWFGGSLSVSGKTVKSIGNQNDIAATLLTQLGLSSKAFSFSKDLLGSTNKDFAFYAYRNGAGWVDKDGKATMHLDEKPSTGRKQKAAMFQQAVYQVYR